MSIAGIGNVMAMNGNAMSQGGSNMTAGNAGADFSTLLNQLMNNDQKHKQGNVPTIPLMGMGIR